MNLTHTEHVRLVSDSKLAELREQQRQRDPMERHLKQSCWRRISLSAAADGIAVRLDTVNEEAAVTGQSSTLWDCRKMRLSWEELADADAVADQFKHEQVCVFLVAQRLIASMATNRVLVQAALSEWSALPQA